VTAPIDESPLSDEMLATYLRTEVVIIEDDANVPAEHFAASVVPRPLHVVTAWNPRSHQLHPKMNAARDARLKDELVRIGTEHHRARGTDPETGWSEDGYIVLGLTRNEARALGAEFQQHAIFEFNGPQKLVIGCTTDLVAEP